MNLSEHAAGGNANERKLCVKKCVQKESDASLFGVHGLSNPVGAAGYTHFFRMLQL